MRSFFVYVFGLLRGGGFAICRVRAGERASLKAGGDACAPGLGAAWRPHLLERNDIYFWIIMTF